ncbi:Chromo domain-containing protein [Mycena venus]|uniref:Chromo domain-containing protein n=1 Tax=Mycena venus TaxID=2733690 RepID=A0A8H6Z7F9_9AGAR|nr:Chromo domain-containing protein [Mycena venus]
MTRLSTLADDVSETAHMLPSRSEEEELDVVEDSEGQSGAKDEEEEKYEFEAALNAKLGQFEQNKNGYYFEWQGHPIEDNSSVVEAPNETEPIGMFWDPEESNEPMWTISEGSPKSLEPDNPLNAGSTSMFVTNMGEPNSLSVKPDKNDENDKERPPMPEEEDFGTMQEYIGAPTWDQLIAHVDTVECVGGVLYVYFTLQGGKRIKEKSTICADKFPKMLIDFYESKLRWRDPGE